jgi:nicotinamide riboside kinase
MRLRGWIRLLRSCAAAFACAALAAACTAANSANTSDPRTLSTQLVAAELAGRRAAARIQEDEYDLNLQLASAAAAAADDPAQPSHEAARAALVHEIQQLRRELRKDLHLQKQLRAQIAQQPPRASSLAQ